jgi:hypothetical protein
LAKKPTRKPKKAKKAKKAKRPAAQSRALVPIPPVRVDETIEEDEPPPPASYDEGCRLIAEAASIDQLKDIADKFEALGRYAKQRRNHKVVADCAAIQNRAEYKMGRLIIAMRSEGTLASVGGRRQPGQRTLDELDIPPKVAARAVALAERYTESEFLNKVQQLRERIERGGVRRLLVSSHDEDEEPDRSIEKLIQDATRWWTRFLDGPRLEELEEFIDRCQEVDQVLINDLITALEDVASALTRNINALHNAIRTMDLAVVRPVLPPPQD